MFPPPTFLIHPCCPLGKYLENLDQATSPHSPETWRFGGWLGPFADEVILFGPRLSFVCDSEWNFQSGRRH